MDTCRCGGPIVQVDGMPAPACVLCIPAGTPLLNWHDRPTRHHRRGCLLCCELRAHVAGRPGEVHPEDCLWCGPNWTGTRPDPCRVCGKTAHYLDPEGRPIHKNCAEAEIRYHAARYRDRPPEQHHPGPAHRAGRTEPRRRDIDPARRSRRLRERTTELEL